MTFPFSILAVRAVAAVSFCRTVTFSATLLCPVVTSIAGSSPIATSVSCMRPRSKTANKAARSGNAVATGHVLIVLVDHRVSLAIASACM